MTPATKRRLLRLYLRARSAARLPSRLWLRLKLHWWQQEWDTHKHYISGKVAVHWLLQRNHLERHLRARR